MAIGDLKTFDIAYSGLTLQVIAIDIGGGQVEFSVKCLLGAADVNAIYWSDGDAVANEGSLLNGFDSKKDSSLNMNGSGEAWDYGWKLSSSGLGSAGTNKATYLTAGEEIHFTATTSWDALDTLGVRATSTSTAEGSIKGVDGDAAVTEAPCISINDVTVTEGVDATAQFTITLEHAYAYDITVDYATASGSAQASSDFTGKTGTVKILAGQTTATVSIDILDDNNPEATETFTVNLSNLKADIPGDTDLVLPTNHDDCDLQGVGTILDTDAPPPPPPTDNFLNNGHELSYATFYFATTSGDTRGVQNGEPSGSNNPPDGVYTVKVNFDIANTGDLDAYYQQILDAIIAKDSHVDGSTTVLGVGIHAGLGNPATTEVFYAIDGNPNDVDVVPDPPGDLAQNNEIDSVWTYSLLLA